MLQRADNRQNLVDEVLPRKLLEDTKRGRHQYLNENGMIISKNENENKNENDNNNHGKNRELGKPCFRICNSVFLIITRAASRRSGFVGSFIIFIQVSQFIDFLITDFQ